MDTTQVMNDTQSVVSAIVNLPIQKLAAALAVLVVGIIVIRVALKFAARMMERFKVEKTLIGFLTSALRIVLYIVFILTLADQMGIPVTSLVALLSLFALAISLSVQNVLANVVSGIVILTAKPFVAGNYIETASMAGTVETINLMYTQLITPDNKQILVPNSELSAARITNYSAKATRRIDLTLVIDYAYENSAVLTALTRAAQANALVLKSGDNAPCALVNGYEETGVQYILRVWVEQKDYWTVYNGLLNDLRAELEKDGIRMAAAVRRVRVEQ